MQRLFLGIKGHVVCLDKQTGNELWRKKLKTDWGQPTVLIHSENVFAYLGGQLYCLSSETGEILWKNGLPGLGNGSCILAVQGKSSELDNHSSDSAVIAEVIEASVDIAT